MRNLFEVNLFVNRSKTHPITPEERIKHTMLRIVKNGFVPGYWNNFRSSLAGWGRLPTPDFKVVNIDWWNEKVIVECDSFPKGMEKVFDTGLLCISPLISWGRSEGFTINGVKSMYLYLPDHINA